MTAWTRAELRDRAGMLDEVPDIPGFADLWGTSAHTCPYCDGFEHRDERLAVLAAGA